MPVKTIINPLPSDVDRAALEIKSVSHEFMHSEIDVDGYIAVVEKNLQVIKLYHELHKSGPLPT